MLRDDADARDEDACDADASLVRRVGPAVRPTVARYRVIQKIAAGSMGVVYRAKDRRLGRDVALKVLRLESPRRRSRREESIARARFVQEARAMARIDHPNVVPIYGIETADEHLVIAMEYVPGQTLAEWLQSPRSWREIVDVLLPAGEGLAAAHAAGAVHRDFKPHNVLVGDDGRVRVTDFGLALVREEADEPTEETDRFEPHPSGEPYDSLTQTGMSVGTPAYMAPEQHAGRSMDPRSDQYAFCATLYEALYGTRPFRGRDNVELAYAKSRLRLCPPQARAKVPRWLVAAMVRGLAPLPEDRFADMHALLAALRGPKRPRASTLAAVGGALVGVLVGGASAVGSWSAEPAQPVDVPIDDAIAAPIVVQDAELARCRRSSSAGWFSEAETHCMRAYFGALERSAFADASTAAVVLADLRERAGAPTEASQWRRHATAARRRGAILAE
jgi:eukaryotic-like serine/threonine-protein kinase